MSLEVLAMLCDPPGLLQLRLWKALQPVMYLSRISFRRTLEVFSAVNLGPEAPTSAAYCCSNVYCIQLIL